PALMRELPQAPANRLSTGQAPGGTILPEHGTALPSPIAAAPPPVVPTTPAPIAALTPGRMRADLAAEPEAAPVSLLNNQAGTDFEAEAADETATETATVIVPDAGVVVAVALANAAAPRPAPIAVTPSTAAPVAARGITAPARPPVQGARQGGIDSRTGAAQAGAAPLRGEHAALPAQVTLSDVLADSATDAPDTGSSSSTPAPNPATAPSMAVLADPAPASAPTPPAAIAPTNLSPTPAIDRSEPRAPAPQQESTIAAVGELREALRAARPELTLRHAEFGPVSLRLEQVGGQDWRAVLASRDPGFVPAIQAALTERAITAAADTAGANSNANSNGNAGQNGTSDQRYGASPNGGQGSSQPYLAQSSNRDDGGQHQGQQPSQQRQPHTTDSVAARAGENDAARADPRDRGVFA
ncbi:MAG: hypothetical protein NWP98_10645, partial [Erythrobacter sp.]|nr:hypothetical protein [Erythrobacter sp.]